VLALATWQVESQVRPGPKIMAKQEEILGLLLMINSS